MTSSDTIPRRTRTGQRRDADAQAGWRDVGLGDLGALEPTRAMDRLGSGGAGLSSDEAALRLRDIGPNAVRRHRAEPFAVLLRQLRNPLLLLLAAAAAISMATGQGTDAIIILAIVGLSVGLGFVNEFRSERAIEALHSQIRHTVVAVRDGRALSLDVTDLVPGDLVELDVGDVVPADLRLLEAIDLECDESILTGESMPAAKTSAATPPGESAFELDSCVFMGTVVRSGKGRAMVARTGSRTAFGEIALRLGEHQDETAFQLGLRDFSKLLVRVTLVLTVSIFVINLVLHRPFLDSALFALAIAVGLTPQLLPAIVTVSLSTGARRLARRAVVVKRLVAIEDLGNIEVLFTDKTGTLTEGRITFSATLDPDGETSEEPLLLGLLCNSAVVEDGVPVGGNPLDQALWLAEGAAVGDVTRYRKLDEVPFDYERRLMSVLVDSDGERLIVTKGAPESVLERCAAVPGSARRVLDAQFGAGSRVVAVATRPAPGKDDIAASDEADLVLRGFLTFSDPPKQDVREALSRLSALGITVKIVTGDNDRVAEKLCRDVGMPVGGSLLGTALDAMSDQELTDMLPNTTIFARVTPDQKSRIIKLQRALGADVAFLGDGVNDAVALHDADVGISVESATEVAKDAADIVLLRKDLGVLADGVVEGRRIFANTIKYVLMGTSSNFGNMFSAAGASVFLKFLPMLPSQILLNNLLYDVSEMTIPTDNVDGELLERPSHWDTAFIRRFMMFFGPISSLYDFLTFGVMLWIFHAGEVVFHSAWFVESLATQSLVIFVIRTRRIPFLRSKPSAPLLVTTIVCAAVGVALPYSPLAGFLGFAPLPLSFLAILVAMIATYLALAEVGKARFFRPVAEARRLATTKSKHHRRIGRLAARWTRVDPR